MIFVPLQYEKNLIFFFNLKSAGLVVISEILYFRNKKSSSQYIEKDIIRIYFIHYTYVSVRI